MNINDFFTHVLGAHLKNPRWSWGGVDTFSDKVYLRVWQDQIEMGLIGERVKVGYPKGKRRSAGFGERNAQIALIEGGAEGFGGGLRGGRPGHRRREKDQALRRWQPCAVWKDHAQRRIHLRGNHWPGVGGRACSATNG